MDNVCSIDECPNPAKTRGWCNKHYTRWQRHGDPLAVAFVVGDDDARFMSHVLKQPNGCWHWTAVISPYGYGKFAGGGEYGSALQAHRWSYARWNGPIPDGWNVDHRCHNADPTCKGGNTCLHRRCVNPAHLGVEATIPANAANSPNALKYRTHCVHGHEYTEANTYRGKNGYRNCRRCHVIKQTILNRKKRAAKKAARQGVRIVPKG